MARSCKRLAAAVRAILTACRAGPYSLYGVPRCANALHGANFVYYNVRPKTELTHTHHENSAIRVARRGCSLSTGHRRLRWRRFVVAGIEAAVKRVGGRSSGVRVDRLRTRLEAQRRRSPTARLPPPLPLRRHLRVKACHLGRLRLSRSAAPACRRERRGALRTQYRLARRSPATLHAVLAGHAHSAGRLGSRLRGAPDRVQLREREPAVVFGRALVRQLPRRLHALFE